MVLTLETPASEAAGEGGADGKGGAGPNAKLYRVRPGGQVDDEARIGTWTATDIPSLQELGKPTPPIGGLIAGDFNGDGLEDLAFGARRNTFVLLGVDALARPTSAPL